MGPFPFAVARDSMGSFSPAFLIASIFPAIMAVAVGIYGGTPNKQDSVNSCCLAKCLVSQRASNIHIQGFQPVTLEEDDDDLDEL